MTGASVHDRIVLDKRAHRYSLDGVELRSVGSVVKSLQVPFDADYWAPKCVRKCGVKTAEEVKALWAAKSQKALALGKLVHAAMEAEMRGVEREDRREPPALRSWLLWWEGAQRNLEFLALERKIGDVELGIAGTLDTLFQSRVTGKNHLFDWKTGEEFHATSPHDKKFLPPFDDLDDCQLTQYSMQLSLYRLILERDGESGLLGDSWVVWLPTGGAQAAPYRAIDLRKRLEWWLLRQKEKQKQQQGKEAP